MRKFRITVDGTPYEVCVEELEPTAQAAEPSPPPAPAAAVARKAPTPRPAPLPATQAAAGDVVSPLAATVAKVPVAVGQRVAAGQELVVLEAMKMYTPIKAPQDGTVSAIHVAAGSVVVEGQPLLSLG